MLWSQSILKQLLKQLEVCETREDEVQSGEGWHLMWLVGSLGRCCAWRASPRVPGCPRDLAVRSSWGHPCWGGCKYLHIHAGSNRHVHTVGFVLPRPEAAWSVPAFSSRVSAYRVFTVIWLQGLHSCLIPGVVFIIMVFFLLSNWSLSRCTFSRFCSALFPGSMGNDRFLFTTKSLRSHSQQEVKQFKCL